MLTFFSELGSPALGQTFCPSVIEQLRRAQVSISMAMLDLSPERAELIRTLNGAAIPVTAWIVLDHDDGYWLTADNARRAKERYTELRKWSQDEHLQIDGFGLDIETPIADSHLLFRHGQKAIWALLARRRSQDQLRRARAEYLALANEMRRDGMRVESYQFPLIIDERRAGSTLLQRALGIVDIQPDREVLMLYRTLLPSPWDRWLIDTFGHDAQAIGVGLTGGGVDFVLEATGRLLRLDELLADLRQARRYVEHVYVFSLEGCVAQGLLEPLLAADLSPSPKASRGRVFPKVLRAGLRSLLRGERLLDRVHLPHRGEKRREPPEN